jgi:DNA replication protein DnaC
MLTEPLYQGLQDLRLRGMARALAAGQQHAEQREWGFAERLAVLIDAEQSERRNHRYVQRLRWAKFSQTASLEELDTRTPRGLNGALIKQLSTMGFIADHRNVLITGPTGVGKSYLACALGQRACRDDLSVRYLRIPRLIEELLRASALQKKSLLFKTLSKTSLLIIDDFGLTPMSDIIKRDLLEILDDRFDRSSTIIGSQIPVAQWHAHLDDPTLADAILDRVVHNAYKIELTGDSQRRKKALDMP